MQWLWWQNKSLAQQVIHRQDWPRSHFPTFLPFQNRECKSTSPVQFKNGNDKRHILTSSERASEKWKCRECYRDKYHWENRTKFNYICIMYIVKEIRLNWGKEQSPVISVTHNPTITGLGHDLQTSVFFLHRASEEALIYPIATCMVNYTSVIQT